MIDFSSPLRYVILPGRPAWGFGDVALHDQVYATWQGLWTEALAEVGAAQPSPDEFLRMDRVTALTSTRRTCCAS